MTARPGARRSGAGSSKRGLLSWALYDWGSNAFPTLIQTFVFAAYFTQQVAADEATGTALWGNTLGAAGLVVAVTGPLLGAIADQKGRHKPWIAVFTLAAVAATASLWFVYPSADYVRRALLLLGGGTVPDVRLSNVSMTSDLTVRVECYAGHRGEETPRRFHLGSRAVEVVEVLDRWLAPEHRYFKVRGVDENIYILRHDTATDRWELTLFVRAGDSPGT